VLAGFRFVESVPYAVEGLRHGANAAARDDVAYLLAFRKEPS
jgi:hypothetical protein